MADNQKPSLEPRSTEPEIKKSIVIVRDMPVILAGELAQFYGSTTKAVNQYRSRNTNKFTPGYAFQLTETECRSLRSQSVTSNTGRGGSRILP